MNVLVTGGAGFIGRNLISSLINEDNHIIVIDNLSSNPYEKLKDFIDSKNFTFYELDCINCEEIKNEIAKCKIIYHLAANPDVRKSQKNPDLDFNNNILATYNLLKSISENSKLEKFVFASSSVVYGEPTEIPTPETYGPLQPISMYGAAKLSNEAMIFAFSHKFNFKSIIFRFANIIGPDSSHGVIFDFINKLNNDQTKLEVLGDGTQSKSYLHISDCIKGIKTAVDSSSNKSDIFNLGSDDQTTVNEIAKLVIEEMAFQNVNIIFSDSLKNGRGWSGDVKIMQLDCNKIQSLKWKPSYNSTDAVRKTIRQYLEEFLKK